MKNQKKFNKELLHQNVGTFDRLLRFMVGEFAISFGYFWLETPVYEYLFYILGFVLIVEAIVGNCFLYKIFGIDTHRLKEPVKETLCVLLVFYFIVIPLLVFMLKEYVAWR